jgi:hypothetical protein
MEKHLEQELTELLAELGVVLDEPAEAVAAAADEGYGAQADQLSPADSREDAAAAAMWPGDTEGDGVVDEDALGSAELSLFQTSREHYGVFYRLDLVSGSPQLRVFTPEDEGVIKMRCYLVRPSIGTPVRDWFLVTRAHDGSSAFDEARDTTEHHLLFAAGEALKRLFWAGDLARMNFPAEIEVLRLM